MSTENITEKLAPINNICLIILAFTAATWILIYTKSILMPYVIALFISMVAATVAETLRRKWKVPYTLGLILSFIAFLSVVTLAVLFITNSIESFVQGADIYSERLDDAVDWFILQAQSHGIKLNAQFINDTIDKLPLFTVAKSVGGTVMSISTNFMLITLFVIFIAMSKATEETPAIVSNIQKQISFYLLIKISVSFLAAFCTWIVLYALKAELATMLAIVTFVLNFIPNIGPLIASALPLPILFLQYGFDWHILLAVLLLATIHFIIGNILETKWLGAGMDLDPIIVLACLIFWSLVWGVMGALLAVPLTAIIKIALSRSKTTRPFADLLAGKYPSK